MHITTIIPRMVGIEQPIIKSNNSREASEARKINLDSKQTNKQTNNNKSKKIKNKNKNKEKTQRHHTTPLLMQNLTTLTKGISRLSVASFPRRFWRFVAPSYLHAKVPIITFPSIANVKGNIAFLCGFTCRYKVPTDIQVSCC